LPLLPGLTRLAWLPLLTLLGLLVHRWGNLLAGIGLLLLVGPALLALLLTGRWRGLGAGLPGRLGEQLVPALSVLVR
jgi:hypothetical protein